MHIDDHVPPVPAEHRAAWLRHEIEYRDGAWSVPLAIHAYREGQRRAGLQTARAQALANQYRASGDHAAAGLIERDIAATYRMRVADARRALGLR